VYLSGASWREVAKAFGYSGPSGAWQAVYRVLDSLPSSRTGYRLPNMAYFAARVEAFEADIAAMEARGWE
jgi:hypothetical protein